LADALGGATATPAGAAPAGSDTNFFLGVNILN
jgi:hypothetical protein